MRGLPGSGKSTKVKEITAKYVSKISADDFFINEDGEYKFSSDQIATAHSIKKSDFKSSKAPIIILDNTNLAEREIKGYLDQRTDIKDKVECVIPEDMEQINKYKQDCNRLTVSDSKYDDAFKQLIDKQDKEFYNMATKSQLDSINKKLEEAQNNELKVHIDTLANDMVGCHDKEKKKIYIYYYYYFLFGIPMVLPIVNLLRCIIIIKFQ